jgi:gliding motility-associated-like protein
MSITVNPKVTPTFTQVNAICEGATLSALPTTSNNSITGTWSPALNNTTTTSYTFTPASTECANTASMSITVNPKVTPTFTQVNAICEGATLSALPTTSNNSITGTWSPALNNTTTTTYTFNPASGECANTGSMKIIINPKPIPVLENGSICINPNGTVSKNYILDSGLNSLQYNFDWFINGIPQSNDNFPTFTAALIGNYSVIATDKNTNCISNQISATVITSLPFSDFTIEQSGMFSDNSTITIQVSGTSETLLYQLDEGIFQSSNIFSSINAGEHIVKVIDPENCTYLSKTFTIIGYPNYFTPNGDGINDTWHVIGLNQPTSKLFIFDRFGKLIKQLQTITGSQGWDGTYNGEKLPSTDYWFSLEYLENGQTKKLRSHFSLKR